MKNGFVDFDLSFQEISKEWCPKVRCFVRRARLFFLDQDEDDLVQELMLHLLEVSSSFRLGQSAFNTFAWTCIKNKIRTIIKQSKRQQIALIPSDDYTWEEIEFGLDCIQASKTLNEKQKFVLFALNKGYKKSEIAQKIDVTEGRVSGLLKELGQKKSIMEMLGVQNA